MYRMYEVKVAKQIIVLYLIFLILVSIYINKNHILDLVHHIFKLNEFLWFGIMKHSPLLMWFGDMVACWGWAYIVTAFLAHKDTGKTPCHGRLWLGPTCHASQLQVWNKHVRLTKPNLPDYRKRYIYLQDRLGRNELWQILKVVVIAYLFISS